jgi:hypothetical protein
MPKHEAFWSTAAVVLRAVPQTGIEIVLMSVEIVPPNDRALPVQIALVPIVIPALSIIVPLNVEFEPRVDVAVGSQKILHADDPDNVITELSAVVKAPLILKIYVPLPERVIPPEPIDAELPVVVQ